MATCKEEVKGRVKRTCQPCSEKDTERNADVFCSTCNEFLCDDCSGCHATHRFLKGHSVLPISEIESQLASMEIKKADLEGLEVCKNHNELFKFFCKQHRALLCGTCAFVSHKHCKKVSEISEISQNEQRCDDLTEDLKAALETTKKALEFIEEETSFMRDDCCRVKTYLRKAKDVTTQMLKDFADEITVEAESRRDMTTMKCTQTREKCKRYITAMTKSLGLIEDVAQHGTSSERFIVGHAMADIVRKQTKDAKSISANANVREVPFNFVDKFDTFKSELMSAIDSEVFQIPRGSHMKLKLDLIASAELNLSSDEEEPSYFSDLAFCPDGKLVAVDNWKGKLVLYDRDLKQITSCKLPYENPFGIVIASNDEIVVTTSWHRKLIFLHLKTSNEIAIKRIIDVSAGYSSISLKDKEHFVVGTVSHDPPVCIVSTSGVVSCFDIEFSLKMYSLDTSSSAYIRNLDKVVLSDTNNNTIYIYDGGKGDKVVVKDDMIKEPFGVAIDSSDHAYVCCGRSKLIVDVTPDGRVLSSCPLDMKYPFAVAISTNGSKIAVLDVESKLNVYKISRE